MRGSELISLIIVSYGMRRSESVAQTTVPKMMAAATLSIGKYYSHWQNFPWWWYPFSTNLSLATSFHEVPLVINSFSALSKGYYHVLWRWCVWWWSHVAVNAARENPDAQLHAPESGSVHRTKQIFFKGQFDSWNNWKSTSLRPFRTCIDAQWGNISTS